MKEIFYGRICSMILDSMGRPYWIMECQKAKSESMDLRSGGEFDWHNFVWRGDDIV